MKILQESHAWHEPQPYCTICGIRLKGDEGTFLLWDDGMTLMHCDDEPCVITAQRHIVRRENRKASK